MMPTISLIICSFNRRDRLIQTLNALPLSGLDHNDEIIVVDNNSTDNTFTSISAHILRLGKLVGRAEAVVEHAQGLSHARNRGIQMSTKDIVAFLDDDAVPAPNWALHLRMGAAKNPGAVIFGGPVLPEFESTPAPWMHHPMCLSLFSILDLGQHDHITTVKDGPVGANMAMRRSALPENPFDPQLGRKGHSLLSGEESMLWKTMRHRGSFLWVAGMGVRHHIPTDRLSEAWLIRRARAEGVSTAATAPSTRKMLSIMLRGVKDTMRMSVPSLDAPADTVPIRRMKLAMARSAMTASLRRLLGMPLGSRPI